MLSKIKDWFQNSHAGVRIYLFLEGLMQYAWGVDVLRRDLGRFAWWSSAFRQNYSEFSLEARLIAVAHRIEKAYSLPETRPGFGRNTLCELIDLIKLYEQRGYSKDRLGYRMSTRAVRYYLEEHRARNIPLGPMEVELERRVGKTGLETIIQPVQKYRPGDGFSKLARSRVSIRNFLEKSVDFSLIHQAVETARYTPSVCNRQAWRVHAFHDLGMKQKLLALQGANRGFGPQADWVLVITADLGSFLNVKERFEVYVDGGLFSMSLMYAFSDLGLGTCALNWCAKPSKDRRMRRLTRIGGPEEIIMLMAVGYYADNVQAAYAEKRSPEEILIRHE
jgi:nitroreductase